MAIHLDPDSLEAINADDVLFVDKILIGWGVWASNEPGPNAPTATGQVLRIASIRDGEYTVRLSDDEFVKLEECISAMEPRYVQIVHLEYRGVWNVLSPPARRWLLTQEAKWRRIGLGYREYGDRVNRAKRSLFKPMMGFLREYVEIWRARSR